MCLTIPKKYFFYAVKHFFLFTFVAQIKNINQDFKFLKR